MRADVDVGDDAIGDDNDDGVDADDDNGVIGVVVIANEFGRGVDDVVVDAAIDDTRLGDAIADDEGGTMTVDVGAVAVAANDMISSGE